jgi:hypothetical protein
MAQKTISPFAGPALRFITADTRASGEADVLREVEELLEERRPAAALERIGRRGVGSPWLANAAAVCRLRMGDARSAVETYRDLLLTGGLFPREEVPTVIKANFAAALIADGNPTGGLRVLDELRQEGHPAVREIRDAVRRWEQGMTFWQMLWYRLGGDPPRPLVLDFPPGRLYEA